MQLNEMIELFAFKTMYSASERGKMGEENRQGALMHMSDKDKWCPIRWLLIRSFCNSEMYVALACCTLEGNGCWRGLPREALHQL